VLIRFFAMHKKFAASGIAGHCYTKPPVTHAPQRLEISGKNQMAGWHKA
jgi:hypothetical protein